MTTPMPIATSTGAVGTNLVGMCVNCISNTEAVAAGAAFIGYVIKPPVHRAMARLGIVNAPDRVAHDVTTVAFLRALDLDPVAVLGAGVVAAAEAWVAPAPARGLAGSLATLVAAARPSGSSGLLASS